MNEGLMLPEIMKIKKIRLIVLAVQDSPAPFLELTLGIICSFLTILQHSEHNQPRQSDIHLH